MPELSGSVEEEPWAAVTQVVLDLHPFSQLFQGGDHVMNAPTGWFCLRDAHHNAVGEHLLDPYGPCAFAPRWWNWSSPARAYRRRRHL